MKNEQSLDEIVKKVFPTQKGLNTVDNDRIMLRRNIWLKGAKYVEERSYSEEEVLDIIANCDGSVTQAKKWFKQFKKK